MRDWKSFDQICRSVLPELVTLHLMIRRRGVNGAATELGVSRQTISNRRAELEQILGSRLIEQHARGQTTPLGTRMHALIKNILRDLDLFLIDMERMRNGKDIRIAGITSAWFSEKPALEECYRRREPDGTLTLIDVGDEFAIETAVREGLADVGIVSYPPRQLDPPMAVEHWRGEPMMLVISGRRRLIRPIDKAEPGDFENHDTFVSLSPKFTMAKELARYLSRNRIRLPHRLSHCSGIDDIKRAVIDDDGISILPEFAVRQERRDGRLQAYALKEPLSRQVGIVYRRDSVERVAFKKFLECFPREKRSFLKPPCQG